MKKKNIKKKIINKIKKKNIKNLKYKSIFKTNIKKFKKLKNIKNLKNILSIIDKIRLKKIIHKNKAYRYKSKLQKMYNNNLKNV